MQQPSDTSTIGHIIEPACVAIVGASEDATKYGGRVIDHLIRHRFTGKILPINSRRSTILGLPAKTSLLAANCEIDVALLALPATALEEAISECVQARVGCAVIIASGLGEVDDAGKKRQAEIVRSARQGGMRILGPNCLGFVSPYCNLAITPSFAMSIPTLPRGGIAVLSQSGALMATMFSRGADNGVGFRACVSFGNQADLTFEDFLEYFAGDDKTTAVVVYAEEIKDTHRFFTACRFMRTNGKVVIVCKAGSSAAGRGTSLSHTASIVGDYQSFQAACVRHQVLLTDDLDAAAVCAEAVARWGIGRGKRISLISGSGGGAVTAADYLTHRGFNVPELEPGTIAHLKQFYATFSGYAAFDYGALPPQMKGRDAWIRALEEIVDALAKDANVDAIVYVMTAQPLMVRIAELIANLAKKSAKPVLLCITVGSTGAEVRARLRDLQCPFVDRINEIALALEMLSQPVVDDNDYLADDAPELRVLSGMESIRKLANKVTCTEEEAKAVLCDAGITIPRELLADSLKGALAAADEIGYPVVLKAVCKGVVHKTDLGLVKLSIEDGNGLQKAWAEITARLTDESVKSAVAGFVIQRQAGKGVEVFVGTQWADGIGPVLVVGFGGLYVELVDDTALCVAPVSSAGAQKLLRRLKLWPLLEGARTGTRLDVEAAADAISRISQLAATMGSRLKELDVNPVIVLHEGKGAVAVDCRMLLQQ